MYSRGKSGYCNTIRITHDSECDVYTCGMYLLAENDMNQQGKDTNKEVMVRHHLTSFNLMVNQMVNQMVRHHLTSFNPS